jgi:hypothetical protein
MAEPDYEWFPSQDIPMEVLVFKPASQEAHAGAVDSFEDQFAQVEDALDQAIEDTPAPVDEPSQLHTLETRLKEQRVELQALVARRLFKPIKGANLQARAITSWQISKDSDEYVWPLRFTGLHGDASPKMLLQTLYRQYNIRLEDIIVVVAYQELDRSQTIDLGLRYAEDLLWLWCLLHGTIADGQYIQVYPLKAMKGTGRTLMLPPTSYRSGRDRAQRFNAIFNRWDIWPTNGEFPSGELNDAAIALSSHGYLGSVVNDYCPSESYL